MNRLLGKLRIGEQIGLGFGLVGLLFLGLVWQYHHTLGSVLEDYVQLQDVFAVRKSLALEIVTELAAAQKAEKEFLILREERSAATVDTRISILLQKVEALSEIDQQSRETAEAIRRLAATYLERFHAIADAWRMMGLDENSGLQGAFREKVHRLQDLSGNFNVDRIYCHLLQIRRSEKDLALRSDVAYRNRVENLLNVLRDLVQGSDLASPVKQQLQSELAAYAASFETYADDVLADEAVRGGKGPFRDAAHRIEAILQSHYVPDLETNVLKLRRREKDYLLRGDEAYTQEVEQIAQGVRDQIASSQISEGDKELLIGLLDDYERDFLALVAQNTRIAGLNREMNEAADEVTDLTEENVTQADLSMATKVDEITASSQARARLSLVVLLAASALGVFFAVMITARIVRPVRQMAGMLDSLTHESPAERIPTVAGARDEINAMAESLNTLADHRAAFLGWWKASMQEANALRAAHTATTEEDRSQAVGELRAAALAKVQQLNAIHAQLRGQARRILDAAERLRGGRRLDLSGEARALESAAHGIETLLEVTQEDRGKGA